MVKDAKGKPESGDPDGRQSPTDMQEIQLQMNAVTDEVDELVRFCLTFIYLCSRPFVGRPRIKWINWLLEYNIMTLEYNIMTLEYNIMTLEYNIITLEYNIMTLEYNIGFKG